MAKVSLIAISSPSMNTVTSTRRVPARRYESMTGRTLVCRNDSCHKSAHSAPSHLFHCRFCVRDLFKRRPIDLNSGIIIWLPWSTKVYIPSFVILDNRWETPWLDRSMTDLQVFPVPFTEMVGLSYGLVSVIDWALNSIPAYGNL